MDEKRQNNLARMNNDYELYRNRMHQAKQQMAKDAEIERQLKFDHALNTGIGTVSIDAVRRLKEKNENI